MEIKGSGTGLAPLYAATGAEQFTLVDIGCSGGIYEGWRLFGSKLRAFGFDPNIAECKRLQAAEANDGVRYVGAFVAGKKDDAFDLLRAGQPHVQRNPWNRLAVSKSVAIRQQKIRSTDIEGLTRENLWQLTELADENAPIYLPDFFTQEGIDDIDFIKIDVDGVDFEILNSLKNEISRTNVLGIEMEVNWCGSDHPAAHTFHNTDRYMRSLGFELFGVTVRKYAMAALPLPYLISTPAQSVGGRPLQGDALYLRDLAAAENRTLAEKLSASKFMKLAALFDMFNLPDHVADLLTTYPEKFGGQSNINPLLDHLAGQVALPDQRKFSYREYMRRFESDDHIFYPETLSSAQKTGINRNNAGTYLRAGLTFRDAYDLERAQKAFENALSLEPRNAGAWIWLGETLLARGDRRAAKTAFCNAMDIDAKAVGAEIGFRATNNVFQRTNWRFHRLLRQLRGS